jgi:hypothetical protein
MALCHADERRPAHLMKQHTLKVYARASRRKVPEICLVIPPQPHNQEFSTSCPLTVWDPQSGHGGGTWGWYYTSRPATKSEAAPLLKRLRAQYAPEFKLVLGKRIQSR